jgi:hypothetical protein
MQVSNVPGGILDQANALKVELSSFARGNRRFSEYFVHEYCSAVTALKSLIPSIKRLQASPYLPLESSIHPLSGNCPICTKLERSMLRWCWRVLRTHDRMWHSRSLEPSLLVAIRMRDMTWKRNILALYMRVSTPHQMWAT